MESAVQVETSSPASAKQRVSKAGSSSWTGTRSTIRKSILSPYPIPGYQWMHSRDSGSRHSFHDPMLDQIQPNSLLLEAQTILSSSSSPRLPPTPMLAHPPSPAPCFSSMGATIPITKFPSAGSGIFEREAYIASALQLPLDLLTMVERPIDCLDSRSGLRNTANARRLGSPLSEGTGPRCIAQERSPSYGGDVLRKRQEQGQIRMNGDLGQNRRPQFLKSQTTAGVLVGRSHLREVGIGEVYTAAPLGQEQARVSGSMNCLPLQDQETVLLSPAYVSDILLTPSSSEPTRQKRWEAEYSSDPLMVQPTAAQGQSCYDVAPDHNHRLEVSLGPDERNRSARHLRNLRDVTTSSPHSSLSYSPSPPISLTCESIPDPSESGAISERLPCGGVEGGSGHHVCHLGRALSVQNSREFAQTSRLDTDRQPEQPRWRRIFSIHHSDEDLIPGRTSGDSLDGMPRDRQERHSGIWDRLFRRRQRVHQFSDQLGSSAT